MGSLKSNYPRAQARHRGSLSIVANFSIKGGGPLPLIFYVSITVMGQSGVEYRTAMIGRKGGASRVPQLVSAYLIEPTLIRGATSLPNDGYEGENEPPGTFRFVSLQIC